jgi:hypothetical protein
MATDTLQTWRDVFTKWPESIPRRGVVVSTLNEVIPFKGFMTKADTLLLERPIPDPLGTRFIVIAYDAIHLLKLTEPLKESSFTAAGYTGQLAKL